MAWVKLDDRYFANGKILKVSPSAVLLHIASMCHCASALNDGEFPLAELCIICAIARVQGQPEVAELVRAGLWDEMHSRNGVGNGVTGYRVHDFLQYNPPAAKVRADRQRTTERVAKWRKKQGNVVTPEPRNGVGNGVGNSVGNGVCNGAPLPSGSPSSLIASLPDQSNGHARHPETAHDLVWAIKAAVEKAQPEHGMWAPDTFAQENASRLLVGLGDAAKAMPELERKITLFAADPEMQPWTVKKFCDQYNGIGHEKPGRAGQPRAVHHPRLGGR